MSKPIQYMGGIVDSSGAREYKVPDPLIERGDVLEIRILSDNPEATLIFNQAGNGTAMGSSPSSSGSAGMSLSGGSGPSVYIVDNTGKVRLHALGALKAEGLTRRQLEAVIVDGLGKLGVLMNPYCIVNFQSYKVTVMGEVSNPGPVALSPERPTIFEALSRAGQTNSVGRLDKVIVVRESMGKRSQAMVNLADTSVFSSPYYHLKQNDLLIVSSDKRKQTPAEQQFIQNITLAASVLSILAILLNTLIR